MSSSVTEFPVLQFGQDLIRSGRVSAFDNAYWTIRDSIVRGRLEAGGSFLAEKVLARELGVSRTPLREAIHRLEQDGLLERAQSGRLRVPVLSPRDVEETYSVRLALETLAVSGACVNITDQQLMQLEKILTRTEAAMEAGAAEEVGDLGRTFDETIHAACGNRVNAALLASLQGRVDRFRFLSAATNSPRQIVALQQHKAILAALKARDEPRATTAVRQHIESGKRSVLLNMAHREQTRETLGRLDGER